MNIKTIPTIFFVFVMTTTSLCALAQPEREYKGDFPPKEFPIIPTAEIIARAKNKIPLKTYNLDTHMSSIRPALSYNSPLIQIEELKPLVESRAIKAEWLTAPYMKDSCHRLLLVDITPITVSQEEVNRIKADLAAKYGTSEEGYIIASWFNGEIRKFRKPIQSIFGDVGKGVIAVKYTNGRHGLNGYETGLIYHLPNYYGAMEFCRIEPPGGSRYGKQDGDWSQGTYTFVCLALHLNGHYRPDVDSLQYLWLLTTDRHGRSHLTNMLPDKPDKLHRSVFGNVERLVEQLPAHSFGFLFTSDRRLYSGRFIEAKYTKNGGWNLTETRTPKL